MRCRECATEVDTARVCTRCGAPIVGQPPVVADTVLADTVVADTVVGAATRRLRGAKGTNIAGVVLLCASALVEIFFIVLSVGLCRKPRPGCAWGAHPG